MTPERSAIRIWKGGVSLAALACTGTAFAIAVADAVPANAQVAEVVVTARKREENVQNIPVAVTAVSGQDIAKFNLKSIEDVAQATPQLLIARGSSGSGADIVMRGIGAATENIGIEQSVSVNVDGVYYGQGRAIDEGLFDVGAVQIMKGPQALFYGKNATAGALAITTNDPGKTREISLTAGYEIEASEPYVEGIVSGPISDQVGVRLAFKYSDQQQGYFKNTATQGNYNTFDIATLTPHVYPTAQPSKYLGEAKDTLFRLTTKWTPNDRWSVTLKGTFNQHLTNNNVDNGAIIYCPQGHPQTDPSGTCGRRFEAPEPALPLAMAQIPGSLESLAGGQDFERLQDANLYLRVNYTAPLFSVTSTTGFQHMINDWADNQNFTNAKLVYAGEHFTWDQFSTEQRVNTSLHGPLNFAGGFYFQTTDLHFVQDVDFLGAENSAAPLPTDRFVAYNKRSATTGHTYALFGQAILDLPHNVEITGGARYTHEIKSSYFLQPYVWSPLNFLFVQYDPANPATAVGAHQQFDNWSPEATITWKPTPEVTLYGAYKTGYKSGGFSNSAILSSLTLPSDFKFQPETAEGFEIGFKTLLFDRQLRFNGDFFDFEYSNLQVDFFNTPTFNYVTLNAASARTYGFEYQLEYAPRSVPGLVLHVDGAYNESHYGHFIAPCSPAGLTYEQGCTMQRVVAPDASYTFSPNCGSPDNLCNFMNVDGRPTALSPKWTAAIGGDYEHPVGKGLKAGLSVNVRVSSEYIANSFPSKLAEEIDSQPAYAALDAVLYLGTLNNRWQLSVIGKNLTNEFIVMGSQGLPLSGQGGGCAVTKYPGCTTPIVSDQGAVVQDPRTIAVQLKASF
jgi:iron complex outermembrane recepter protein